MVTNNSNLKLLSRNNYLRKYIISWLVPLFVYLIIEFFNNSFGLYLIFIFSIFYGLINLGLRKVSFNQDYVFYGAKKIKYENIIDLTAFRLDTSVCFLFKTNNKKLIDRYFWCEFNIFLNLLAILISIFSNKRESTNLDYFTDLLIEKSNISPSKKNNLKTRWGNRVVG